MSQPKEFNLSTMSKRSKIAIFLIAMGSFLIIWNGGELLLGLHSADVFMHQPAPWGSIYWLALIFGMMAVMVVLHEWMHGLAFKVFGGKPRYGFKWKHFLGPVFYTTSEDAINRVQYQAICLAPQVLSVICLAVLFLAGLPLIVQYCLLVLVTVNVAGGCGDFFSVWFLRRYPRDLKFRDTIDGFRVVEG